MDRREFSRIVAAAGVSSLLPWRFGVRPLRAQIPGGTLDPLSVPKYVAPLVQPPSLMRDGKIKNMMGKNSDYYEIAVRQFQQQILPAGLPQTTVWSYGPANDFRTVAQGGDYFYPAFSLENKWNMPTVVKWINGLVDADGNHLPHLLPVDETLHWANPRGPRDHRGSEQAPYTGPVPMVTHVHGAHTAEESDGYAEAWWLPDVVNMPSYINYQTGTFYDYFNTKYNRGWGPGFATFEYPNDQPATTLWYHDHTLGMTRLNVYAGPAGYYIIRGGPNDVDLGYKRPSHGNPFGAYTEIPIAIQDRSFNADGGLFYPDTRAFFEGLNPGQLQIPFIPDTACDGLPSDVSPIWNPEFFGNMMVVNGQTWPFLNVEQTLYRFRFLNGCNSRFLILKTDNGTPFYQLGGDQGFLPAPVMLNELLMAPAERADVVMDFTNVPVGTTITLLNLGPDEPFGGGMPGVDFDPANPDSTGQVMQFRVTAGTAAPRTGQIPTALPAAAMPGVANATRNLSLNEEESQSVRVVSDSSGNLVLACGNPSAEAFAPTAALLGTLNPDSTGNPMIWMDPISENPDVGATEEWAIHNFTEDAHPIHIHQTHFQVVSRQAFGGAVRGPEAWETGYKDTVIAYPGEITRVKALYDLPGYYVWHCHIVEHEDNEMMRPFHVGPIPADGPAQ